MGQDYPKNAPNPCGKKFGWIATLMLAYAWTFGRDKK